MNMLAILGLGPESCHVRMDHEDGSTRIGATMGSVTVALEAWMLRNSIEAMHNPEAVAKVGELWFRYHQFAYLAFLLSGLALLVPCALKLLRGAKVRTRPFVAQYVAVAIAFGIVISAFDVQRGNGVDVFASMLVVVTLFFIRPVILIPLYIGSTVVEVWAIGLAGGTLKHAATTNLGMLVLMLCVVCVLMYSERLRRGKAEEDLETLASTDALTGLGNMRAFSRVCQGVPRDATTMLIIDVDDFKVFNDTYGHYAGNRILSCIGQALEGGFGSHALCFRMGGDEFAVISDSQDEKGLLACLEDATARLSCLADGMGLEAPTLSVGFSSVQTDGAKTYEDLLKYADKHLYQEKGEKKGAR